MPRIPEVPREARGLRSGTGFERDREDRSQFSVTSLWFPLRVELSAYPKTCRETFRAGYHRVSPPRVSTGPIRWAGPHAYCGGGRPHSGRCGNEAKLGYSDG